MVKDIGEIILSQDTKTLYEYLINNYKKLYTKTYQKEYIKDAKDNSWNSKAEEIKKLFKKNE